MEAKILPIERNYKATGGAFRLGSRFSQSTARRVQELAVQVLLPPREQSERQKAVSLIETEKMCWLNVDAGLLVRLAAGLILSFLFYPISYSI